MSNDASSTTQGASQPVAALDSTRLIRLATASIAVALVVLGLKYTAYLVTGSVALYSDALESIVNVLTAIAALVAIRIATRPADHNHPFGHHKAEYFSAVLEGALIIVAALMILREAVGVILVPRSINEPALGLAINGLATALNAAWGSVLISRGKLWRSPALEADGHHVLTDVWTSLGVFAGVALAAFTGWQPLDPLIAGVVALNILWTGYRLARNSMSGLMDEAASPEIVGRIEAAIAANGEGALQAHDIRTRAAGRMTFIEFHLVVPGEMTVEAAHEICDRLENAIEAEISDTDVVIHVEPDRKAKTRGVVHLDTNGDATAT